MIYKLTHFESTRDTTNKQSRKSVLRPNHCSASPCGRNVGPRLSVKISAENYLIWYDLTGRYSTCN